MVTLVSMGGFTKLFSRILTSSIWSESNEVRIVWITLLAATGPDGIARVTIPGLSRLANIALPDTEKAVSILCGPDRYSRSVEHDGRRVREERDGEGNLLGFFIYNYSKHRAVDATAAERQRRARKNRKIVTRDRHARQKTEDRVQKTEDKQQTTDCDTPSAVAVVKAVTWSQEACTDWISRFPGSTAPGGKIGKALKPLVLHHGWPEVRGAWQNYLAQVEDEYVSPAKFAETYSRWNGSPVRSKPGIQEQNVAALTQFVEEAKRGSKS